MTDPFYKLNLLHLGHIRVGSEWRFDSVISPFSRLYLVMGGIAWVYHHQKKYELKPGYLYLIPSFSLSRYQCDTVMEQYYLSFLEEPGSSIFDQASFCYETPALANDEQLFSRLLTLHPNRSLPNIDPKAYDNRADLLSFNQPVVFQPDSRGTETQGILLQLLSRFIRPADDTEKPLPPTTKQFSQVLAYIHTHLHEKLSVEQLAALQRLNVDYFSRQFQAVLGSRPIDYIINKRMEQAQLLVATSSLSLPEIAEQVGIADIYYFSRLFKRRFGMPPGRYRKLIWNV